MQERNSTKWSRFFDSPCSLRYLSSVVFEDGYIFDHLTSTIRNFLAMDKIPEEKLWLSAYYEKDLKEGSLPKLKITKISDEIGHGLFADAPILASAFIGEYAGVLRKKTRKLISENDYCLRYPIKPFVIDAKEEGNYTRFINHSDSPNLEVRSVLFQDLYHMIFIAMRPISKGEQLTFDYGKTYWRTCKKKKTFL